MPAEELQNFGCSCCRTPYSYLAASDFTSLQPVNLSGVDEDASHEFAIDEVCVI
jgi:hypothetical protein